MDVQRLQFSRFNTRALYMSSDARKGRGKGNNYSSKWYDSPLWDAIDKKKKKKKKSKE